MQITYFGQYFGDFRGGSETAAITYDYVDFWGWFTDAFSDPVNGGFVLDFVSPALGEVTAHNAGSGIYVEFYGDGLDAELLGGTVTRFVIGLGPNREVLAFSGMEWAFSALVAALRDWMDGGNRTAFDALLNAQPVGFSALLVGAFDGPGVAAAFGMLTSGIEMIGTEGQDTLEGGQGNDTIEVFGGPSLASGAGGNDRIEGSWENDTLLGGSGRDSLFGRNGDDRLEGGDGNDRLEGEDGDDLIFGGDGDDLLRGGDGADTLEGHWGTDRLVGGAGNDSLSGGALDDTILGQAGDDLLLGDWENDLLRGNGGNDTLSGGRDDDIVLGGTGRDRLNGDEGNDTLEGRGGFDTLEGGTGNDLLTGGANADRFIFADGHGADTIDDFEALNDAERIDLSAVTEITSFSDLSANHMTQVGADVVIDAGGGNSITLSDVALADLDTSDFVF